jgi:hypothetical protein
VNARRLSTARNPLLAQVLVQDTTVQCMQADDSSPPVRVNSTTLFNETMLHDQLLAYECLRVRTEIEMQVSRMTLRPLVLKQRVRSRSNDICLMTLVVSFCHRR